MTVTAAPRAAYKDSVPPHPDSGSSGCPPTQTTVNRAAPDAAGADINGSEFAATIAGATAASDCVTKLRRVRSSSFMEPVLVEILSNSQGRARRHEYRTAGAR